jgi:ATP-binding cassette subfamily C (CFTR/MRP) protein 1
MFLCPKSGIVYAFTQRYYVRSSRELQRWESVLRSPILSHFTETLEGSVSIRAYGMQYKFLHENEDKLTANLRAYYPSMSASRWLGVRLDIFGNLAVVFAAMLVVYQRGSLEAGLGSLAISYAMSITNTLSILVRVSADWETNVSLSFYRVHCCAIC